MARRKLRLIHNMARSGSTLICKCLGCMDGVRLLSELHPLAWRLFNPVEQAVHWFGLLTQADIESLQRQGTMGYSAVIELIERRCSERGEVLVLRDWAHLDYTGVPFLEKPSFRPLLYDVLAETFDIVRVSTARDPVAQWQSLTQLSIMKEPLRSGKLNPEMYLAGYRRYAELCVETGFVRYEDLLSNPSIAMADLCGRLEIGFDSGFLTKWHLYKTITGDVNNPRTSDKIAMTPRRPVDAELAKRFAGNADYQRACELLSYDSVVAGAPADGINLAAS